MSWKTDLAFVGGGMAIGGVLGGVMTGARRLNKHIQNNTPDRPADYVTMMGDEYNTHFHTLKKFCKTKEEKSFLKTLRHRLSRLIKLAFNDNDFQDSQYWSRFGEIAMRLKEVKTLVGTLQFLVKERYDNEPILGFDDAIVEIRQIPDDLHFNNTSCRTDIV